MVNDHAAAERFAGGWAAQDIPIPAHSNDGVTQFELDPAFFAGFQLFFAKQAQGGDGFACADKEFHFTVRV